MRYTISKTKIISNCVRFIGAAAFAVLIDSSLGVQMFVNLGEAGNYAVLAKSGISTVPASAITGNMGVSPIESSAITGFSLILDSSGQFSTSSQVTGKIYAPDYANPTPANLTQAVQDMLTAYNDAAGRTIPDYSELGTGNIGGLTLAPGLYKWSTSVSIPSNVTLSGGPSGIWIFQIAGDLTLANNTSVILSGGAQPGNIFWQVAGGVGVDLGTTSQFTGTVLAIAGINLRTDASLNGRLLAQTAVTLDANAITATAVTEGPVFGSISRAANGVVTMVITNSTYLLLTIQSSTNLVNWTTIYSSTPSSSPFTFIDSSSTQAVATYYRAFNP